MTLHRCRCLPLAAPAKQIWVMKVWLNHSYISFFTKFDPWLPRPLRVTLLCAALIGNMYWAAFFFAFVHGRPGEGLPPLSFVEQAVLALMTQACLLPVHALLIALFLAAGRAEFRWGS
jgi:hypothetical protein